MGHRFAGFVSSSPGALAAAPKPFWLIGCVIRSPQIVARGGFLSGGQGVRRWFAGAWLPGKDGNSSVTHIPGLGSGLFQILLLMLTTVLTIAPATSTADENSSVPLRVYLVLDNSGSMDKRVGTTTLNDAAIQAVERWANDLQVPSSITVEVLTASDKVDVVGTFALRSEPDREALIDAVRRIKPAHGTTTQFAAVDHDLAGVIQRDTAPGEGYSVIFATDTASDDPKNDLRAEDIGDRTFQIHSGVFAVILGNVPASQALDQTGRANQRTKPQVRAQVARSSTTRRLYGGRIRLDGPAKVAGVVTPRLFGGQEPARAELRIFNDGGVARLVALELSAPPGVAVTAVPNPAVIAAGGSALIRLELAAPTSVQGDLMATARLPDGRSEQHVLQVYIQRPSWMAEYYAVISAVVVALAMAAGLFLWRGRRPIRVGDPAEADRQASLAPGDTVPLSTFASGAMGALHRSPLGFSVVADDQPLAVGGRPILPKHSGRYVLGEEIRSGDRTFAVYNVDGASAADSPTAFANDAGWGNEGGLR